MEGYIASVDTLKESSVIKEFAYKIKENPSTVASWIKKYLEKIDSPLKVELKTSSLKSANKKIRSSSKKLNL